MDHLAGAGLLPSSKPKKARKKARFGAGPGYTVQEGEDMLLLISNTGQQDHLGWRPVKKRRAAAKGKGKGKKNGQRKKKKPAAAEPGTDQRAPTLREHPSGALEEKTPCAPTDQRWGRGLPEELLVSIFQMVVVQDGAVPFLCR